MRAFIFILAFVTLLVVADSQDCPSYIAKWAKKCCNGETTKKCKRLVSKIIKNRCNIARSEVCHGSEGNTVVSEVGSIHNYSKGV